MKDLLAWSKSWINEKKKNYIGGEWVTGNQDKIYENENPATNEILSRWNMASFEDVNHSIYEANAAFKSRSWIDLPMRKRASLLRSIGSLIRQHENEFAILESLANGKTYKEALTGDLPDCSDIFDYYAGWIDKVYGESVPVEKGFINFTRKEPLGVCALIVPWNFPLLMACWKLAPALSMGNSIIIKPSEHTPFSLIRLFQLIDENLDLPKGLINLVLGDGFVGEYLSSHSNVHKVSFTGSTKVGKNIISRSCRSSLKSLSLELGGKSPNIIFADCPDLKEAINRSFDVMFSHKGEKCSEPTRFYLEESIYDKVLQGLVSKANNIICGDPLSSQSDQGPQCHKLHFDKIIEYIDSGIKEGAKLECGGFFDDKANNGKGYYVRPTIFSNVNSSMRICQEEIFGPVLCISKFKTENEALALANNSMYGLAAGVWTSDISRAHRMAQEIDAGMVFINRYGCYDFSSPFGGFKESGWGKDMAIQSIDSYTKTKSVWIQI